ncbi:MAG: SRPBCC family protein, partial [Planctomycetota bacterium]
HGTIWDSVFTLEPQGPGTMVRIAMDARAQKWLPRVLNPLMRPLFRKGLIDHLDALEAHFGSSSGG